LFPQALGEYLKGNWYEAESICHQLLRGKVRDVEAQLMLATILRHTGRYAEARARLDDLQRLDDAAKWEWEIANELERLVEAEGEAPAEIEPQAAQTLTPMLEAA
jgi:cytochrome c-type biogenesis protein CcmH/NrfG